MDHALNPKITVLMAVYNGEKFLKEAINSILSQTFVEFEFLIINDGSIDGTDSIIKNLQDERITYVINEKNIGCVQSFNKGMLLAKADIIARMDADDISKPTRLKKQFDFLNDNPEIDIIGSHITLIDETSEKIGSHAYPISNNEIKANLLFGSPFAHPSVMFKNDKFRIFNLSYLEEYKHAEDYDLWQRALIKLKGANYDEPLLDYRISSSQISTIYLQEQQIVNWKIRVNALKILRLTSHTIDYLNILLKDSLELAQAENFRHILNALFELFEANDKLKVYDNHTLRKLMILKLEKTVTFYSSRSFKLFFLYRKSNVYKYNNLTTIYRIKCFIKQLIKT